MPLRILVLICIVLLPAAAQPGKQQFENRCAPCHGADAKGGERGPDISAAARARTAEQLRQLIRTGSGRMPPMRIPETELAPLIEYTRTLGVASTPSEAHKSLKFEPYPFEHVLNPASGDWPTYHGALGGNRHSPLRQINQGNVAGLSLRWMFPVPAGRDLEVTPVVIAGVMYVTAANQAFALDASTGRELWHFRRPRTEGLAGDAASGINRGVAVLDDKVFLVTDNAHLLALHRGTGKLVWETTMANSAENYGATSAPLIVNDLVVSGISGGDEGARGFVAAYKAATGERAWRFWTVPVPGEPLASTWQGRAIEHGCGTTWLTGTYDAETNLLFWTTGNPCPDYNGDERKGDNLYTDSVVALAPATGELRWYFQFTPHDLHDWDAQQTSMAVNASFQGKPRKLLLQASRNGFFYVLDRTNGKLLLAKPFVERLTWASGIGADGRPVLLPGTEPSSEGATVCPAVEGATNWMSTAFNQATGLFYVMALEKCNVYTKSDAVWQAGQSYYGGATRDLPGDPGRKILRALDINSGKIVWEFPQQGRAQSWGGVLSTSGNLVFIGADDGAFTAVDALSGKLLWSFHANSNWKASPMTYTSGGRQYIAIAAGSAILAFGL